MNTKEHARLKVHLKMSVTRLRNLQQKKTALAKANRRDLAALLTQGKDASARIRVENIIREDINVELLEILELYCELLLARIGLLESKICDPGLEEAVKSLIYSAHRSEVKELVTLRQMFTFKYGKAFESEAMENSDDKVSPKVIAKLSVQPPPADLVTRYLREIARTYHVDWHSGESSDENDNQGGPEDDENDDDDDEQPGSGGIAIPESEATLPDTPARSASLGLVNVALPSPTSENPRPKLHIPPTDPEDVTPTAATVNITKKGSPATTKNKKKPRPVDHAPAPGTNGTEGVDDQSFDALMARFEKLKRG